MADKRLFAAATSRNRDPILEVLRKVLPTRGLVLEIASGSGEHAAHFARELPGLIFAPSDPSPTARDSIAAWIAHSGAGNIRAPLSLDAASRLWPVERADAILCINMTHISPWAATAGLFVHGGKILPAGAPLYLYGPFRRNGAHTAQSNADFDESLRARNPAWGLRDVETIADLAAQSGFEGPEIVDMPANNLSLIFRRRADAVTAKEREPT